jgi:hypothetical protein
MRKQIGFAAQGVTSAAKAGRIPRLELRTLGAHGGRESGPQDSETARRQTFAMDIIERYRRRESSVEVVEEALIKTYLAGISEPKQEDLRQDRGLAEPADRRRSPVPLSAATIFRTIECAKDSGHYSGE